MKTWKHLTILALLLLAGGCDLGSPTEATGGGTGVEGLTGVLVTPSGAPAVGAQVRLYAVTSPGAQLAKSASAASIASAGDAAADSAVATATVSATGSFLFKDLANGTYNVAATFKSGDTTLSVFVRGVVVAGNTNLGTDTLRVSGGLSVQILAGANALHGATCMIPASPWHAVSDSSGTCVLTGLPPGAFQITVSYPGLVLFVSGNLSVSSGNVANAGTITLPGSGVPTDTLPPPAPTLIYPYTGAYFVAATPTFTWDSVPGALAYHFQMIGSNHVTIIIGEDSTLTVPSRVYGPLEYQVQYQWRVRARNSFGWGPWSSYATFTRDNMPVMPETPQLSSPAHNATGLPLTPTFVWSQLNTAQAYHLQIHTDTSFINPVRSDTIQQPLSAGTLVSRAAGPLTGNTTYYWRVRTWNSLTTSTWSEVRRFTTASADSTLPATPVPTSPAQFATGLSRTPSLTWNLAAGASTYHLQISTVASFTTLLRSDTLGPTLPAVPFVNITLDSLADNTTYYWRVRSSNSFGASAWSEIRQFTVGTSATPPDTSTPSAPTLVSPEQFAIGVSTTPTLIWNIAAKATSYDIQVSTSANFATLAVSDTTVTGTSKTLPFLTGSIDYYWRVRGRNTAGAGAWSETRRFRVSDTTGMPPGDTSTPAAPTLVSPAAFVSNLSTTPTLTWNASSKATSYDVQVSTATNFATLAASDTGVTGTSKTLSPLTGNTTYYWRIRGRNAAGAGEWSIVRQFTVGTVASPPGDTIAPAMPTLLTPAQFATNVSTTPTLTWSATSHAASYDVQVSISAAFTNLAVNDTAVTATSRTLPPLTGNTDYYWRVRARNAVGTSAYSSVFRFTTGTTP